MKKIIAILMAVVMMMAVAVPAFAAEAAVDIVNGGADQAGDVTVSTTFDDTADWSYTVTIPADASVSWGTTEAFDMKYEVESQLLIGASLDISAEVANNGEMTNENTEDVLTLTVLNGDAVRFSEVNAAKTTAPGVVDGTNVKAQVSGYESAAVGTYTGSITYTVVYNAPTA